MTNKIDSITDKLLDKISAKIDNETTALDLHTYATILNMLKSTPDLNDAMKSVFNAFKVGYTKEEKDAQNKENDV